MTGRLVADPEAATGSGTSGVLAWPDADGAQARSGELTWTLGNRTSADILMTADWREPGGDWGLGDSDGRGVRVCVIDSGVEGGHPIVGAVNGSWTVEGDTGDYHVVPSAARDAYGHGTACAGVIRRLSPACEIHSVRVLDETGGGVGGRLLAGLAWAVDQGFEVINLSLSTRQQRYADDLRVIADEAFFAGSVIVASAHNAPVESYPWRFSSVISVGAHAERDHDLYLANPRPPVEFFAPGQDIEVAWRGGTTTRVTGNSFATAFVAGLCARVLSRHPRLTPFQLKTALYLGAGNVQISPGLRHEAGQPQTRMPDTGELP